MRLETERLIIRSIQKGDEKALADMAKDGSLSELGFDENCSQWIEANSPNACPGVKKPYAKDHEAQI